jgi:hypothetical protein
MTENFIKHLSQLTSTNLVDIDLRTKLPFFIPNLNRNQIFSWQGNDPFRLKGGFSEIRQVTRQSRNIKLPCRLMISH